LNSLEGFIILTHLIDHLVAASASQRSLIAYLDECAEEWDISHNPGEWSGDIGVSLGYILARSWAKLKVIRIIHLISGDDANV